MNSFITSGLATLCVLIIDTLTARGNSSRSTVMCFRPREDPSTFLPLTSPALLEWFLPRPIVLDGSTQSSSFTSYPVARTVYVLLMHSAALSHVLSCGMTVPMAPTTGFRSGNQHLHLTNHTKRNRDPMLTEATADGVTTRLTMSPRSHFSSTNLARTIPTTQVFTSRLSATETTISKSISRISRKTADLGSRSLMSLLCRNVQEANVPRPQLILRCICYARISPRRTMTHSSLLGKYVQSATLARHITMESTWKPQSWFLVGTPVSAITLKRKGIATV
mmetsp:Transcript_5683/g.11632  ORF Transcript_5683/g.11632 Transcript_5683/m.11632 type:complete len:279 (+) Transcript_5683:1028-1864(+)